MTAAKAVTRLNLPEALTGRFTGLIIGTYGADLEFLERFLLPRLPRTITNRVLLADAGQLHRAIDASRQVRRMNRTYVAAPLYTRQAHHPKFLLLTGPKQGRLLVGSGNATLGGYTSPGEAFTKYQWTPEETDELAAFTAIREFLTSLNDQHSVDDLAWRLISDQFTAAPWITSAAGQSPVIHNLHTSHLEQLQERLSGAPVIELVMYAPFHDRRAAAITDLLNRFQPEKATLLIQPRQTALDLDSTRKATASLGGSFQVVAIDAPDKYGRTLLHAKFILLRTPTRDYLLQGSANLSAVALCRAGAQANVELGSILSGPPRAFDEFLHAVSWAYLPRGLDDVTPADLVKDEPPAATFGLIRNLAWMPPDLTGTITQHLVAKDISVMVSGELLPIAKVALEPHGSSTRFALTFGSAEAKRIDDADRVEIGIRGHEAIPAFPYRVNDLLRLSSAGHRLDLLREAGKLALDDKEILDLLRELDRVLIVDGHSVWRLAHPQDDEDEATDADFDSGDTAVRYEDIDWELIRKTSTYRSYLAQSSGLSSSPTDLQVLLDSLVGRFRAESRSDVGTETDPGDGDLTGGQEPEDPDEVDERADDDPEGSNPRQQGASTRNRRMWRSFVKRYVNGLKDPRFIEAVGSAVVMPSYVAFNHLCRRLRILDLVDPDFLTEAQIALWSFMWGSDTDSGYLSGLPSEERALASTMLVRHDDVPNTLAAIDDVYWHVWLYEQDVRPLRDAARRFLVHDGWTATGADLRAAATVATGEGVDTPAALLHELSTLVTAARTLDIDRELAAVVGLRTADIYRPFQHSTLQLPDDFDLTVDQASALASTWQQLEPDRSQFHLRAGKRIVHVDLASGDRVLIDLRTSEETPLVLGEAPLPPWLQRLGVIGREVHDSARLRGVAPPMPWWGRSLL